MSKKILLKIDDELYELIKKMADVSDRKVTQEVRYLIKRGINLAIDEEGRE